MEKKKENMQPWGQGYRPPGGFFPQGGGYASPFGKQNTSKTLEQVISGQ